MSYLLDRKISRIDAKLESLKDERRRSDDPTEILRASESIDFFLDERLKLMRERENVKPVSLTA